MEKIVLDSSVGVKWFVEEEESEEAKKLLDLHKDGKISLHLLKS